CAAGTHWPADRCLALLAEVVSLLSRSGGRTQTALCRAMTERTTTVQQDSELEQEWLRQNNIIYGALIAVGVFMAQPFLTATSLDLTARICIVAFAVAIPLLAALMLINRQEAFRHQRSRSTLGATAQVVAQVCAFIGVVAGFGTSCGSRASPYW